MVSQRALIESGLDALAGLPIRAGLRHMATPYTPDVPGAICKPWSRTLPGLVALGALIVIFVRIIVGGFGIEDIDHSWT